MSRPHTVIFLPDGMADEPVAALGGRTPLQAARTPAMDSIAREGCSGTLLTLPEGFPTSSEVANMSVLGCDLPTEFCGRGPLEAAGRGVALGPGDVAFRLNLVSVEDGILKDYSAGHLPQAAAEELVAALNAAFGAPDVRFHAGVGYRNILVLSGPRFSERVRTDKPDDNHGERVAEHLPAAVADEAAGTAAFLRRLIAEAPAVLEAAPANRRLAASGKSPANGVWPWSGGRAGALRTLAEKYGITGAVISAVDVIMGLGRCLGMDVIRVPGATGYIDTNYEGKARAAIEALRAHDLVYLHVEAIDEVSHERNLGRKLAAIEDFDSRVVAPVLNAFGADLNACVLPDHPVPVALGKHTRTPVPVAVRLSGRAPDGVRTFDEVACRQGSLGAMRNGDLMNLLFGRRTGA
ncbi:MAG: cofactor-independent phosphoglycerate mutase [Lentisphaerae bacterium]|nr:cofactor-independent phosphoglycerate mutase [Lentisphaerota bacterium]